jgi:hypothetical protein
MDIELMRKYALRIAATYALKVLQQTYDENYFRYAIDKQEFWWNVAQLPPESYHWKLVQRYFELMFDPATPRNHSQALYKILRERL